eukprot:4677807-Pleurochrysis_carterae.AAC.1
MSAIRGRENGEKKAKHMQYREEKGGVRANKAGTTKSPFGLSRREASYRIKVKARTTARIKTRHKFGFGFRLRSGSEKTQWFCLLMYLPDGTPPVEDKVAEVFRALCARVVEGDTSLSVSSARRVAEATATLSIHTNRTSCFSSRALRRQHQKIV